MKNLTSILLPTASPDFYEAFEMTSDGDTRAKRMWIPLNAYKPTKCAIRIGLKLGLIRNEHEHRCYI